MADDVETNGGSRLPQPTEEVHLPDPSYLPVLVAFGTMITLIGIVNLWPIAVLGGIIVVISIFRWIGQARREMRELPLEQ